MWQSRLESPRNDLNISWVNFFNGGVDSITIDNRVLIRTINLKMAWWCHFLIVPRWPYSSVSFDYRIQADEVQTLSSLRHVMERSLVVLGSQLQVPCWRLTRDARVLVWTSDVSWGWSNRWLYRFYVRGNGAFVPKAINWNSSLRGCSTWVLQFIHVHEVRVTFSLGNSLILL